MEKQKRLPTHMFLASLGKTMLRPGGKEATNRIIEACKITKETKVLEVAPNMGTTAIYLAKKYGCQVTGVDIHEPSVEKAQKNVEQNQVEDLVHIQRGNALALPFEDHTFDVVINEAMLSMMSDEQKKQAISEYYRVLKPGGRLATHDLLLMQEIDENVEQKLNELRALLVVHAQPLTKQMWEGIFSEFAFEDLTVHIGKLGLLSLRGLVADEGWDGLIRMIENARKNIETEQYFLELINAFDKNDDLYGHITFTATKPNV